MNKLTTLDVKTRATILELATRETVEEDQLKELSVGEAEDIVGRPVPPHGSTPAETLARALWFAELSAALRIVQATALVLQAGRLDELVQTMSEGLEKAAASAGLDTPTAS